MVMATRQLFHKVDMTLLLFGTEVDLRVSNQSTYVIACLAILPLLVAQGLVRTALGLRSLRLLERLACSAGSHRSVLAVADAC